MNDKFVRYQGAADCEPLHYTACGLDDVYLLSGYERHPTRHGNGVSIKDVDELHCAIAVHLVNDKKALTGKEFRFLRKFLDLTQAELGGIFGVGSQTVARWEKGECSIDGPAETAMRILLLHRVGELPPEIAEFLQDLAARDENPHLRQFFGKKNGEWVALPAAA